MTVHSQLTRMGLFDARVPRYTSYPTSPQFAGGVGPDDFANWIAAGAGGIRDFALCACAVLPKVVLVLRLSHPRHGFRCASGGLCRNAASGNCPAEAAFAKRRAVVAAALGRRDANHAVARSDARFGGRDLCGGAFGRGAASFRSRLTRWKLMLRVWMLWSPLG